MKYVKTFENYKSDDQIQNEYSNYTIQEFKYESRSMSFMYNNGAFEAMVVWEFEDVVDGGFNESVEDVIYTTVPDESGVCYFKYAVNNWYPESVYMSMISTISEKLNEKYNCNFQWTKTLPSK